MRKFIWLKYCLPLLVITGRASYISIKLPQTTLSKVNARLHYYNINFKCDLNELSQSAFEI